MRSALADNSIQDAKWLKVSQLSAGMQIAVCDPESSDGVVWDEIVSIESVGREHVYDIEVEDTHNFVAGHLLDKETHEKLTEEQEKDVLADNHGLSLPPGLKFGGLVAHNTYIGGNLGIGTTNPSYKLDVAGDVYSSGVYRGGGADYAEYFYTVDTDLTAGEAVCLDLNNNNAVKRCTRGADNDLMGVVSSNPSIVGNSQPGYATDSHYVVIGMLGQLNAKVSAENGAIAVGDELTSSSSTPGYLMKANIGHSTVGVAMEPLNSGTGLVKVLIARKNKSLTVETVEAQISQHIATMALEDQVNALINQSVADLNLLKLSADGSVIVKDVMPAGNKLYNLGSPTNKFANIYGDNIVAGDLTYTETTYAVSGDTIMTGDTMALYVSTTVGGTHTVPIDFRTAINNANYGSGKVVFDTTGNMGVGTSSPTGKLHIYKSTASGDGRMLTLQNYQATGNLSYNLSIVPSTGDLTLSSNDNSQGSLINNVYSAWSLNLNGANDNFAIKRSPTGTMAYVDYFHMTNAGNVGIGSSTPSAKFAIAGGAYIEGDITAKSLTATSSITAPYFVANSAIATSTFSGGLAIDTNGLVFDWNTNNVGIGTASAAGKLNVIATTEQLRLGYDASNYWSSTVGNTGGLTLAGTGTGGSLTLTPTAGQNLNISLGTTGDLVVNTNQLYVDTSSGFVGLGTTTPAWNLQVAGTRPSLALSDYSASANNKHWLFSSMGGNLYIGTSTDAYATSTPSALTILNNGYFGLGTSSPSQKLSTDGLMYIGGTTGTSTIASNLWVQGTLRTGTGSMYLNDTGLTSSDGNLSLQRNATSTFGTNGLTIGTNQFVVQQTSGNVGIGTTTPASKLDSYGVMTVSAGGASSGYTANGLGMGFDTTNRYGWIQTATGGTGSGSLILNAAGNSVGIGTTTPNWQLQVSGTRPSLALSDYSAGANQKHWLMSSMGGNLYIGTSTDAYGTSTPSALTILNNGNVGIGTSSPSQKLSTDGLMYIGATTGTSTITSNLNVQGQLQIGTGSAYFDSTGLWLSSGNLSLQKNGGNVGIGTSTPTSLLNLASTANTRLILSDTNATLKHWFIESNDSSFSIGTTSDALATNASYRALTIDANGIITASTTIADNISTAQLATTAFAKGQDAVIANPKAMAQAVNMTYAGTGSSGIRVTNDANINFGTGNFTLVWKGSLPDWTPSAAMYLLSKYQDGNNMMLMRATAAGTIDVYAYTTAGAINWTITSAAHGFVDGTTHEIVFVADRTGNATWYIDGVLSGTPVNISADSGDSLSLAIYMTVLGFSDERDAGTASNAYTYNRALTAAEVLDRYRNGVAFNDKWGSQGEWIVNGTMEADSNWITSNPTYSTINRSSDYVHSGSYSQKVHTTANGFGALSAANFSLTAGKRYKATIWVTSAGAYKYQAYLYNTVAPYDILSINPSGVSGDTITGGAGVWTNWTAYLTPVTTASTYVLFFGSAQNGDIVSYWDDTSVTNPGATLALEPEGIKTAAWYDSSTNGLNASYPASGSSLMRKDLLDGIFAFNGNVGIGTTTPGELLEVNGGRIKTTGSAASWTTVNGIEFNDTIADANARRWAIGSGVEKAGALVFRVGTTQTGTPWNGGSIKMVIDNAGNVGIGTTTPGTGSPAWSMFDIYKDGNAPIAMRLTNTQNTGYLVVADSDPADLAVTNDLAGAFIVMSHGAKPLQLGTNNNVDVTILSGGNVGIGTTGPGNKLDVYYDSATYNPAAYNAAGLALTTTAAAGDFSGIRFTAAEARESFFGVVEGAAADQSNFVFQGYDGTSHTYKEFMRINDTGNVGIGTTNPVSKLHIDAGAADTTLSIGNNISYNNTISFNTPTVGTRLTQDATTADFHIDGAWSSAWHDMIHFDNGTGNVGIGTTNPATYNFQVNGTAGGTGAWQTSDARWKQSIETIGGALDKVNQLRGVTFEYNQAAYPDIRFPQGRQMGLIAQEAETVVPEIVMTDSAGYKSIAYQNLTALLINAVQELNASTTQLFSVLDVFGAPTSTPSLMVDGFGNLGIGTSSPTHKLEVAGDIGAMGFVNLSTREAKKDIEYLTADDYESVLAKISDDVKVATYYYNSDEDCSGLLRSDLNRLGCTKRFGLIAEEAPADVLSSDGHGVDLYKLASFTLAGVKEVNKKVDAQQLAIESLESRMTALEGNIGLGGQVGVEMALETLSGEPIELSQNSILALSNSLYSSVLNAFKSLGLVVEQGIVRAQKLIADTLQFNKLVVNTSVDQKDPTIGNGQINVNELDTYILNNQVSTTTKIFVTPDMPVALGVCEQNAEQNLPLPSFLKEGEGGFKPQGFRVCMNATSSQIIKFSWWIVETTGGNDQIPMTNDQSNPNVQNPNVQVTPSSTPTPSETPVATPEPSAAGTPTETPAVTTTPTPTPSETPAPTPSVTPEVTATPTPTPSETPLASPSATEGQATPTPSETPVVSPEASPVASPETASTPTPEITPAVAV